MTGETLPPSRRSALRQIGAAAAAPFTLAAARGVDPMHCGAAGDGRTNDLAAVTRAVSVAAERRLPVVFTRPHHLALKGAADSIALPSGSTLVFQGGSLIYDYVGGPVLWGKDVADIRILNPWIRFNGRMPAALQKSIPEFYATRLQPKVGVPGRDTMAAIGLYGCSNVEISGARFEAMTMAPDTLIPRCIVIACYVDGRQSRNVTIRDFQADGFYFGVMAWGVDGLQIDGLRTRRWGQLDTTKYSWEAPSHPIYVTPQAPSKNVTATNLIDEGEEVAPYYGAGSTSFKFTGVSENLTLSNLWSRRSAGLLDFHGKNFNISGLFWQGRTPEAIRVNKVIRGVPGDKSEEFSHGVMKDVHLILPAEFADFAVGLGGVKGDNFSACTFSNWLIEYAGDKLSPAAPLIRASMSRCTWRGLRVNAPDMDHPYTILRVVNGGTGNQIDFSEGDYPRRFGAVDAGAGNTIDGVLR